MKHITLAVAILSFVAQPAAATDGSLPEYAGVYLLMESGKTIKLPQMTGRPCSALTSDQTYEILSGSGRVLFNYLPANTLSAIPVVDGSQIKGIYINSRDERIERINQLTFLDYFLEGKKILTGVYKNGCKSHEILANSDFLAFSTWGWEVDHFNVGFVNEFVSLVTPINGQLFGLATRTGGVVSSTGNTIPAIGFYVVTNRGNYPFLTVGAGKAFLDSVSSGSPLPSGYTLLERVIKPQGQAHIGEQ